MSETAIGRILAYAGGAARRQHLALYARWRGKRTPMFRVHRHGLTWELRLDRYVDREIALGTFEPETLRRLRASLGPDMCALDVGANIGYFALLMAHWTGPNGHVWASEPTQTYRERLVRNLIVNKFEKRVTVLPYGLSNMESEQTIAIGVCSATLHPPEAEPPSHVEHIVLRRLDDVVASLGIRRLDIVKVDIDGHELAFMDGARQTLTALRPVMVLEFNQANLEAAGTNAESLRQQVESLGYELRSERSGRPFRSRLEFMRECANYCCSANVWAYPR